MINTPPTLTSTTDSGMSADTPTSTSYTGQFQQTVAAAQDMAVVRDRIWLFDQSDIYHSTAKGWIHDPNSLAAVGQFTHNISHAATASYQRDSDTLMIGNAGDKNSAAPRIDLLTGFSAYGPGAFLDFHNPSTTPRVSIPLISRAPDGSVLRSLFPDQDVTGISAVWIDSRTILAFSGWKTIALSAVRLRLGIGTDDYSGVGFGTFRPGLAATDYNGTAMLLDRFASDLFGVTQGAEWHNGKLYLGWTSAIDTQHALEVLELSLTDGGRIALLATWRWLPTSTTGVSVNLETEGVTFHGNNLLVTGRRYFDNAEGIYSFSGIG